MQDALAKIFALKPWYHVRAHICLDVAERRVCLMFEAFKESGDDLLFKPRAGS